MFKFQAFSRKQRQIFTWWADKSPVKDAVGIIADGAIRSGDRQHEPVLCDVGDVKV